MRGESKQIPVVLRGVQLIELIPHCLYEVPRDCHEQAGGIRELTPGRILSRNLKVSERLNQGHPKDEINQCFISYDGVFKARRGVGHADRQYQSTEIPANRELAGTLDELLRMSWELHHVDEEERRAFALIAVTAANTYGSPIDQHKVEAQRRTVQAGTPLDVTGRFNPGRIPLICFAGEHEISARIQAVRGIGRRMSFRETVLEHYIDRLREILLDVSRSQQHRLRNEWLAATEKRTPRSVRAEADRLQHDAQCLRRIVTRPISRSLMRSVQDMDEAVGLLREAAAGRNGEAIERAKGILGRVYRAMILLDCLWRLEELLLQLGILQDRGETTITDARQIQWRDELEAIHHRLTRTDSMTGRRLEEGFQAPVLGRVVPHVHLAKVRLMRIASSGGADLPGMKEELERAVTPL
jgi:hypothetical protein